MRDPARPQVSPAAIQADERARTTGCRLTPADAPVQVEMRLDEIMINGLVYEHRMRATGLFRHHVVQQDPTAPIDIPPWCDIRYGVATHVKSHKASPASEGKAVSANIDMACSYRLFLLRGTNRLLIGLYDEERRMINGRMTTVLCYHTVVEAILSPATLERFRGRVDIDEIKDVRDGLAKYIRHPATMENAGRRFHGMTERIRDRMGIARSSVKLDATNKRVQAQVSIAAVRDQLAEEAAAEGWSGGVNYHEFTAEFYGLALPWRTTGKDALFEKVKGGSIGVATDPYFMPAPKPDPARSLQNVYGTTWKAASEVPIPGAVITIRRHEDGMRTMVVPVDRKLAARIASLCRGSGGMIIEQAQIWLMTLEQTTAVVEKLRRLPDADGASIMTPVNGREDLRQFDTPDGKARALRLERGYHALRAQGNDKVAARIAATCRDHGVGKLHQHHAHGSNWLIPQTPTELIERVVRAIRDHGKDGRPGGPTRTDSGGTPA